MNLQILKKIRVIISLIFFISFLILFFDLSFSIQSAFAKYPIFLQFIPSLKDFLATFSFTVFGFFIIIILTLFLGRVYCSVVCPLGILQDIIIYLRDRKKRIKNKFSISLEKTRYAFLIITIFSFLFGISIFISLLDPYSNFGRILSNIFRPAAIHLNNFSASMFEKINLFVLNPLEFSGVNIFSLIYSILFFLFVFWMSYKFGRLYCNTVCPVGTFLGILSKFSIYKIAVIEQNCISCGDCETVCKANCIESESQKVDFTRCVGCFNCFDVCPSIGISYVRRYSLKSKKINKLRRNSSRRNFLINIGIFTFGYNLILEAQKKIEVYKDSKIPVIRKTPISPPGSISVENFIDKCTACSLCVASCPTQVLQPSFLEYGLLGIFQPRMDYLKSYCNYDCVICSEVCPTGAIIPQDLGKKQLIQLGKAKFVKENCVVYSQKTDCGACAEHCPTKAVEMIFDKTVKLKAPFLKEEICIGCGACEHACPTKPYKSIYVEGNSIHQTAQKPKTEKINEKIDLKEEFPF